MRDFKRTIALLSIANISVPSISPTFAASQKDNPCVGSKIMEQSCANSFWVNPEKRKPFQAERVVTHVKLSEPSVELSSRENLFIARDSDGRIHEESHLLHGKSAPLSPHGLLALGGIPTSHSDLNFGNVLVEDAKQPSPVEFAGRLTVSILDCFGGTIIQFTCKTNDAMVRQACADTPAFQPNDHPYSDKLARFNKSNAHSEPRFKDLGYGTVEGLLAHGIRVTWCGTEKDPGNKSGVGPP